MSYASGGVVEATDYNNFVASVNAIWGVGSGDSGYGQSTTLSTVTAAVSTVTATQWSDLITRIDSMRTHQSNTTSGITKPNAGDIITYLSTLSSQISTATTNRLTAFATGTTTTTTVTNAVTWATTAIKEVSLTWANAAAMRYWFNAGGYVTFTGANSALSGTTKSTDWDTLLTACGTVEIDAQTSSKVGGSGSPTTLDTNKGFYDLTTSYAVILKQYSTTATGGYNLNYAQFEAKLDASPGSSTVMTLKMTLQDDAAEVDDDQVFGTVQLDYAYTPPSTTVLSNVWGSVSAATITNTQTGISVQYAGTATANTTTGSSYSFATQAIGAADSTRIVGVFVHTWPTSVNVYQVSNVTIGSTAATLAARALGPTSKAGTVNTELWYANIATGTTATVALNVNANVGGCVVTTYAIYNATNGTPNTAVDNAAASNVVDAVVTASAGHVLIAGATGVNNNANVAESSATANITIDSYGASTTDQVQYPAGSYVATSTNPNVAITFGSLSNNIASMVVGAWR